MTKTGKGQSESDRRRAERYVVNLPAEVLVKGKRVNCRLVDISSTGALVETSGPVSVGDRVSLDLPDGGPTLATVVRVTATHIAMAFPGAVVISNLIKPATRQ